MFFMREKSIPLIFPLNFKFPNNSNSQVFGQFNFKTGTPFKSYNFFKFSSPFYLLLAKYFNGILL